jgi:hypothetical protein
MAAQTARTLNSVDHRAMLPIAESPPSAAPLAPDCRVVELRQYTLHPGRRDDLITLFDREFVETQEAVGIRVLGQFRDLDDADRFVWLRGFADMAARGRALPAFYGGPVWAAHRDAANATMVDSDDVLLLRPAWDGAALPPGLPRDAPRPPSGVLHALVLPLRQPPDAALLDACRSMPAAHAQLHAWYATETAANNFPRLPVREGEQVLLALALFSDAAAGESWRQRVQQRLQPWLARAAQCLRLAPTSRSALHA